MSETTEQKQSWFARLKAGLSKSSGKIASGLSALAGRKLDDALIEEIEDLLIGADLGPAPAAKLAAGLAKGRFDKTVTAEELREALAGDIAAMLEPVARPLVLDPARKPHVVLIVGVNGSGKTTTIGKLARQFKDEGRSVMLAACLVISSASLSRSACKALSSSPALV